MHRRGLLSESISVHVLEALLLCVTAAPCYYFLISSEGITTVANLCLLECFNSVTLILLLTLET